MLGGALEIFMQENGIDVATVDYDDKEAIDENI